MAGLLLEQGRDLARRLDEIGGDGHMGLASASARGQQGRQQKKRGYELAKPHRSP